MARSERQIQEAALEWLANGETGISSETMAFWLVFGVKKDESGHPHDPDDFDRCLQFLNQVPEMRSQLLKMVPLSSAWKKLVARWSEIEAMHLDEVGLGWTKSRSAPRTYELMTQVLDGEF